MSLLTELNLLADAYRRERDRADRIELCAGFLIDAVFNGEGHEELTRLACQLRDAMETAP